ncbi:glycosyltransferase family 39 protein [Phycomyces blakesleeanus]|uniref:Dolichyl-phosphate-mannose--protein mannosyltransferase n=2 Tax=Phycomyces blakesleeanus TaxID=4837 RepID=A0A162UGI8_PHYB8|nr:glycosyltransferase family 39 protein [Phycomyces blakesleeanus NRRL 1555(-)]OAD75023.1 glycosyltransferase family 39 protein [Phycomyces blakesleeanus NRRL 1555(-)]|eukprot:XP_018293063.1 glycosyltransferase family 39 protein [Phycomyces blakesleeanus NRRL 1555(-)]
MENLKRRHPPQQKISSYSPPPPYSDIYESVSLNGDNCSGTYSTKEKSHRIYKDSQFSSRALYFLREYKHTIIAITLTAISLWTRFRKIDVSDIVVWDEAHFGKFGSFYLKNEFYFDVHPPLGKMLVGLSGYLAGYNGSFGFDSGKHYPPEVNFKFMRLFNATWGALLVPLAYLTATQFKMSQKASLLAATMVLADTAYLCISRFILLDSMLLFFTCLSLFTLSVFHNLQDQSFSKSWWLWLVLTGLSLGCVLSVKWVGLFAVALVGLYTAEDLWEKLGDVQMPKKKYMGHWIARIICLIVIPAIVYLASFKVHFAILRKSGPGDGQMSSLFQAQLEGNSLSKNPLEVAFGSNVTIKNVAYGGGLLHSHPHLYPSGSTQQQITCYHHKDPNNEWGIAEPRYEENQDVPEVDGIRYLKDGDVVRLVHLATGRNLHTHPIAAPITSSHWEVSGYGNASMGDIQDNWKIEIVKDLTHNDKNHLRSLSTRFRLRNVQLGCLLGSHNTILPQWGYKQYEVYCDKRNQTDNDKTLWNIEEHKNEKLPKPPKNTYKSKFLDDFIQLNVAMWTSNNALIPDPDKEDILASTPLQWPFVSIGLRMCGWGDKQFKFYLLGNPIVWWLSSGSLVAFSLLYSFYSIRAQRQINDMKPEKSENFFYVGKTLFLGWFLHYAPFFIMGRVTYLHHYFPSLYFSIFMAPFLLDHLTAKASARTQNLVFGAVFTAVIGTFIYFAPFAYGMMGPISSYAGRRWLTKWNLLDTF